MIYNYTLKHRPLSLGTQPKDFTNSYNLESYKYEILEYNRPLSLSEIEEYELKDITIELLKLEMNELTNNMVETFKNKTKIGRLKEIKTLIKELYIKPTIKDNIKNGIVINTKTNKIFIGLGYSNECNYRVTTFDRNYQALSHQDYNCIQELVKDISRNYITRTLEIV